MNAEVTHLRHVSLAVTAGDFDAETVFFQELWGLEIAARENDTVYFAAPGSNEPFVLRVHRSTQRRTEVIAFGARSATQVDSLANRLQNSGIRLIDSPHALSTPGGGYGLRFFDHDGRAIEVSADVADRTSRDLGPKEVAPMGLSHVVLHTPDPKAAADFYEGTLGFRVSDWLDDRMCFLRCNEMHHCLAFLTGAPALNHIAFDVGTTDRMMRGVGKLVGAGVKLNWGPGRHTAGDNTFAYFFSPTGTMVEYTAELEQVPDDWTPTRYPMTRSIADQWGTGAIAVEPMHRSLPEEPGLWQVGV